MDNKDVERISDGVQEEPEDDDGLFDTMVTLAKRPTFQKTFSELGTIAERIKFVLSHECFSLVISKHAALCNVRLSDNSQYYLKSDTKAAEFGHVGTGAFEARRYEDALVFYSKAIRYAPHDSGLLPISFGNRSGAYFQLMQYESALKDIEAAQSHPQYKPFFMLTIRKCQCLIRLGRVAQAKQILYSIKRSDLNQSDAALLLKFYRREGENLIDAKDDGESKNKNIEPELLKNVASVIKILSKNGRFVPQPNNSSLSSKVEVHYDEKNGRHLVTTQDVHFGDILAITKPYASVLTEKQERKYCHHCLTTLRFVDNFPRSVPCTQCTRVLYCCENCRSESWQSYHQFECPLLAYSFEQTMIGNICHYLALRTWFVAGGLKSIRAVTQKLHGDPAKSAEFTGEPMDCYENVYRMKVKESNHIERDISTLAFITFLFKLFKLNEIDDTDVASPNVVAASENAIFAIETLQRHYQQIFSNEAMFVRCDDSQLEPYASTETFVTLDPLIGLVHKSCNPNISIIGVDYDKSVHVSNVCVFFAIKPIPTGTVLSTFSTLYNVDCGKVGQFGLDEYERLNITKPCPCEHCQVKRLESPFGCTATTYDGYEIVCCGATCAGFIRQTGEDAQVNCSICKRNIGPGELVEMNRTFWEIFELHTTALELVGRAKTSILNDNSNGDLFTLLLQLETLINDRIAPLALMHSRPLLVDLYKKLDDFYRYCYIRDKSNNKLAHLQKAWKYAEASHTTLERHFGGDSLCLLVALEMNVPFFSNAIREVGFGMMDWIELFYFCLNLNENGEDETPNMRVRLVESVRTAQTRLDRINECYKMI